MFCTRCGAVISQEDSNCQNCGRKFFFTGENSYYGQVSFTVPETAEMIYPSDPPRNPLLALLLSFLVIGVGQLYVGQVTKGIALFIVALLVGVLFFPYAAGVIWAIGILDAPLIARKLRHGYPVRHWEWF